MKVTISWDKAKIAVLSKAIFPAAEKTIDALRTELINSTRMPFDNGDMQNNQTFAFAEETKEGVEAHLVTGAPQARRLYYHPEYNFQKINPEAGAYWAEPWISGEEKGFAEKTFGQMYKEGAGLK